MANRGMIARWGACSRNKDLILKMNHEGASLTQIGRKIGTNKRHVKAFLRLHGETRKFPMAWKGEKCNHWKGGRIVDQDGYVLVYCPGHPGARNPDKRYILEHRLVMENHIGRYLLPGEVCHHRNKNRADNRIENLELFSSNPEHLKSELTGKVPKWTSEGKARMQAAVNRVGDLRRGKSPHLWPRRGESRSPQSEIRPPA